MSATALATPTLTKFQMQSLEEAALSILPTYMLMQPEDTDAPDIQVRWSQNNHETDELVSMGLLEDVSKDFSNGIEKCRRSTGRTFRVFKITTMGRLLFQATDPSQSIN
jgi:hypothetical protein